MEFSVVVLQRSVSTAPALKQVLFSIHSINPCSFFFMVSVESYTAPLSLSLGFQSISSWSPTVFWHKNNIIVANAWISDAIISQFFFPIFPTIVLLWHCQLNSAQGFRKSWNLWRKCSNTNIKVSPANNNVLKINWYIFYILHSIFDIQHFLHRRHWQTKHSISINGNNFPYKQQHIYLFLSTRLNSNEIWMHLNLFECISENVFVGIE